jgi:hypothetical protein
MSMNLTRFPLVLGAVVVFGACGSGSKAAALKGKVTSQPMAKTMKPTTTRSINTRPNLPPKTVTQQPTSPPKAPMTGTTRPVGTGAMMGKSTAANLNLTCNDLMMSDGQGFCVDDNFVVFCSGSSAYYLDCRTFSNDATTVGVCAQDMQGQLVDCELAATTKVDDMEFGEADAFGAPTGDLCDASEDQLGVCGSDGRYLFMCKGQKVIALDCQTFTDPGTGATASCLADSAASTVYCDFP